MKKAQTEMLGLLAIVVLFIFIGLLYMMFAGKPGQESLTRDVTQVVKVQNMLDAFIQVTPCYTKIPYDSVEEVIKNCYTSGGGSTICEKPCKDLITGTLDEMMKAYSPKQAYEFKILKESEEFLSKGTCPTTAEAKVATERIVAGKQALTIQLKYCT